jgi:glutamate formiminotransferase/formiminotetrahydrofolate cyclodeaminase
MKAYKQAKAEPSNAGALIAAALKEATNVPLSVAQRAKEIADMAERLKPMTNPNMKSDLTTAAALARAALEGAISNVEINVESLDDQAFATHARQQAQALKG